MSAILESLNALSAAGLAAVLNTLWLALAVAAVIWLALRLMPRVNGATRHAVWWAVLALVVLMPLATLPRPAPSVPSPARTEKQIRTRAQSSSSVVKPLVATDADAPAPPLTSAPLHALYSRAAAAPRVRVPFEFHPGNWPSRLLFLWMALSCVLLGRIVRSYLHLRGLRNRARPASAELVVRFEQRLRDSRALVRILLHAPSRIARDRNGSPILEPRRAHRDPAPAEVSFFAGRFIAPRFFLRRGLSRSTQFWCAHARMDRLCEGLDRRCCI